MGERPPLELRIHAEGAFDEALVAELGRLEVRHVPGGAILHGPVMDAAELWGVLHRLHRAGIRLRSLERLGAPDTHPATPGVEPAEVAEVEVRIEVNGYAAGVVSVVVGKADVFESPPSTTLVMRLPTDGDVLFDVLDRLEGLALDIRGIRVEDQRSLD